ncbi:CBL-interacting serine/threonine-protein kinase 2 [Vigna radiata var. radiata]|uniref:CBL-interacting serine/threonine-protein kinase 2 n=1 Tax=Vigna radiata var. radiata TaxID=3916 RepID=A0A1S3U8I6_VIGRR|nr:CBL-interacting serine/threonine-protein kinase 2 [Vigna radiata var. radiata]XP_014502336.1 CBL-interacting serine/threonine-protein kinase 2 [Vigna radiata var. radiata]XP_014502338.1 CBL-interacting serine/threonine-protein kinase 2 [Vigna radiata var. radiata]XP_022636574.1 CBL-interacting serine/threonine-protein kinase 2 [Vigna radiata var. radiata]
MAQDIGTPPVPFDFELLVGDPENLRTVKASSSSTDPWIEPERLKLRHRIGRGPFGDVWLATHHQSTEDYDEYHEVAAKMLPPIREEHMKTALEKFFELYFQCQGAARVFWLLGISILNGRICIIMNFYEGSVGDKMAKLREGRISLPDVLRYGIDLAQGILELHSKGILVLNLKPSNVLLDDTDQAILGDAGIPNILFGSSFLSSDTANRLGTPNYMAPEQWQPEVRGPVSFETDSWGFGCTIVEMLIGNQPWYGCPVGEIYRSVVEKYEKPQIPGGLPSSVENVLSGCFEYDLRNRPSMVDILSVFRSARNAVVNDGGWKYLGIHKTLAKSSSTGYTQWSLSKDHLQVGDTVRSRKPSNSCNPQNMEVPEGNVVGNADHGFVLVRLHGVHDPVRIHASTLERVTNGLGAGDWVRIKEEDDKHSPVGILHSINREGRVSVGFIGLRTLWKGNCSELEMAESYCVGLFIRLKPNILSPRFEWLRRRGGTWATGKISRILPNGCLVVNFPGMLNIWNAPNTYLADPSEVDVVSFKNCPNMIEKYQHVEDHHWAIRPVLIAFGLLSTVKIGMSIGKRIGRNMNVNAMENENHYTDSQNASSPTSTWTSSVANILFREGS